MVGQGARSPALMPRLWTFHIQGGKPFQMEVPRHPRLDHDGRVTLWKLVATASVAQEVVETIKNTSGAEVRLYTEEQSSEQLAERLATQRGEETLPFYDYKCAQCGHEFEQSARMNDPCPPCPNLVDKAEEADETPQIEPCGGGTFKLIKAGGSFHLKGTGWYKTDYKD